MTRMLLIFMLAIGLVMSWPAVYAEDGFYVIPTKKRNYAPVEKTGQTKCYEYYSGTVIECSGTGQDGEHQKGVTWPTPRFTDNQNGTVTDNLTGLIWLKNAKFSGPTSWSAALNTCFSIENGVVGLTDGSSAGDWRLPNLKELLSLNDYNHTPAIPFPNPFGTQLWSDCYWSSTTVASDTSHAWAPNIWFGTVYHYHKEDYLTGCYVWPVRDGK